MHLSQIPISPFSINIQFHSETLGCVSSPCFLPLELFVVDKWVLHDKLSTQHIPRHVINRLILGLTTSKNPIIYKRLWSTCPFFVFTLASQSCKTKQNGRGIKVGTFFCEMLFKLLQVIFQSRTAGLNCKLCYS